MKKIILFLLFVSALLFARSSKNVELFIDELSLKYQMDEKALHSFFSHATFRPDILKIYNTPFKAYKNDASWTTYKSKIITDKKIKRAKAFMTKYKKQLLKAENMYHVPKEYIAAFIGVETNFGLITGKENVFDCLTTLAFHKNRKEKFFRDELESFLVMCRAKGINPITQKGSFAGAMGCVQQLPSVHLKYGVDFDGDGDKNLYDMDDCIGTIANFMHANGWNSERLVAVKANYKGVRYRGLKTGFDTLYSVDLLQKYGIKPCQKFDEPMASLLQLRGKKQDELWLGAKNFRVLTTYNNSTNYGMAIFQIAQRLKK